MPGLAVDPEGTRALVVTGGNRVGEVDLDTMEVGYHDLSAPVLTFGARARLAGALRHAKAIGRPRPERRLAPNGLVAVSGAQYTMDGDKLDVTPAGLVLIDPSDWSVPPARATSRAEVTSQGWCASRPPPGAWVRTSRSCSSSPRMGRRASRSPATTPISRRPNGSHLYATTSNGTRFEIVDLETGETVGRAAPRRETWLLYLN